MSDAVERLRQASKARGEYPNIGKWHVIDPADLRAILAHIAALEAQIEAKAHLRAIEAGQHERNNS